jgi:hypothetical protein
MAGDVSPGELYGSGRAESSQDSKRLEGGVCSEPTSSAFFQSGCSPANSEWRTSPGFDASSVILNSYDPKINLAETLMASYRAVRSLEQPYAHARVEFAAAGLCSRGEVG